MRRRSSSRFGMLLDRDLNVEELELARSISAGDPDPKTSRRTLAMALRDIVSDQEAEGKTKKCLTRAWLNPPPEASSVIEWGRTASIGRSSLPAFHFGALLASFPFFGVVAKLLGQHLQHEGSMCAVDLRSEVRRTVGDRPSVDVAARKAYTTMRNLGVVQLDGQVLVRAEEPLPIRGLDSWLVAAVLATRGAKESPVSTLVTAPELLGLRPESRRRYDDSLIEIHGANGGAIAALRVRPQESGTTSAVAPC